MSGNKSDIHGHIPEHDNIKKEVAQETMSEFEEMCRIVEKEHPDWGWDAVASCAHTRLFIKKVGSLRKYGGHDCGNNE